MAKIFIGQYYGKSWLSKLIKWRTWSDVSHSSVFLPDPNNDDKPGKIVIEAWRQGVVQRPWHIGHKKGTKIKVYSVECTTIQQGEFYTWISDRVGDKYDPLALIGFVTRTHMQDSSRWICSELIFEGFLQVQMELLSRIKSYQVSPKLINIIPFLQYEESRKV